MKKSKIIIGSICIVLVITIISVALYSINSIGGKKSTTDRPKTFALPNDIKLELSISDDWKYEEMPKDDEFEYTLKFYKSNKENYALLQYDGPILFCGTGRKSKDIVLNNGSKAKVSTYSENTWEDIIFYDNRKLVIFNYNLDIDETNEFIEIIKTINIIGDTSE